VSGPARIGGPSVGGLALAFALAAAAACTNRAAAPITDGAAQFQVGPGPLAGVDDAASCGMAPAIIGIPAPWATAYPIQQETEGGDAGAVHCTVTPDGKVYRVDASVFAPDGASGFALRGTLGPSTGAVTATFVADGVTFASQGDCSVDFTAKEGMTVASDRLWAFVTCPRVTDARGHTCFASAELHFYECKQ
jgi:hypothetical protein